MSTANRHGTAIGFCTYKRVHGLRKLLAYIAQLDDLQSIRPLVIICDNDGTDPAVGETVAAFEASTGLVAHLVVEKTPGIAAARNAVFDKAEALHLRFLAMLDDDEWPSAQWLTALLHTQAETGVAVVGGPVVPEFPADKSELQKFAKFWSVERQFLRGRPLVFCTCNFLIDLDAIANVPRPLFDPRFGLTGGGDTVFFRGLFFAGFQMDWTEQALVSEEVPPSRASYKWLRQRRFRVGNHAVQQETETHSQTRSILKTLGLTVRLFIYPLFRREPKTPLTGWLLEWDKVRGRYSAHFGGIFVEYGRQPKGKSH